MPLQYQQRLLAHLAHDRYKPACVADLAEDLGVDDPEDFARAVEELADRGVVHASGEGAKALVSLPSLADKDEPVEGVFRKNPRGFGFVILEYPVKEGDVFVPANRTRDALTGDRVLVEISRDRRGGRGGRSWGGGGSGGGSGYVGTIIEIIKRRRTNFTGELSQRGGQWLVWPDGRQLTDPILVRDASASGAKEGEKVVVEMIEFPEGRDRARG